MLAQSSSPSDWTLVIIALIAAVPASIAAWQSRQAKVQATQANAAVNNVGPGEPTLRETLTKCLDHIARVDRKIDRHLSWHQITVEQGDRAADPPGALDERRSTDNGGHT